MIRGWRVLVPVVLGNAAVQAATVAPALTPGFSGGFLALVLVSLLALVISLVLVTAQVAGRSLKVPLRWWLAAAASLLLIAASAVLWLPLVLVTITATAILLPARMVGPGSLRVFTAAPWRAVGLTLLTVLVLALLWAGALLSGFFVTGPLSSALTWVVLGIAGVLVLGAWARFLRRAAAVPAID